MLRKISIAMVIVGVVLCAIAGISVSLNPRIEKVMFTETEKTLTINTYCYLEVDTYPEIAKISETSLEWESSDTNVAVVDKNGRVWAAGVGEAVITAKYVTNTIKCKITVNPVFVTNLYLDYPYSIIHPEEEMQINAIIEPSNATYKDVTWNSSNPQVATVSNSGLVTGVSAGETTITVNAANGIVQTRVIKVQNVIEVENISLSINVSNPTNLWISTFTITPTITPANADNQTLSWESSNSAVISVDSEGKIVTRKDGSATITASTANGKTGSIYLNIPRVEADTVMIDTPVGGNSMGHTINVGTTLQLHATLFRGISTYPYITSQGITTRELEWSSSDPSKVSISESGLVTALESTSSGVYGNFGVTITVKVKGLSNVSDTYIIYVE